MLDEEIAALLPPATAPLIPETDEANSLMARFLKATVEAAGR